MDTHLPHPTPNLKARDIISATSATGAGEPIKIDPRRIIYGAVPISVTGNASGFLCKLQGNMSVQDSTPATDDEHWVNIDGGQWTENKGKSIVANWPWIRGYIFYMSSGTLSMKGWL